MVANCTEAFQARVEKLASKTPPERDSPDPSVNSSIIPDPAVERPNILLVAIFCISEKDIDEGGRVVKFNQPSS